MYNVLCTYLCTKIFNIHMSYFIITSVPLHPLGMIYVCFAIVFTWKHIIKVVSWFEYTDKQFPIDNNYNLRGEQVESSKLILK